MKALFSQCEQYGPLIGSNLIGGMFLTAGTQKIMGFTGTVVFIDSVGLPMATLLAVLAIVIEVGECVLEP